MPEQNLLLNMQVLKSKYRDHDTVIIMDTNKDIEILSIEDGHK